MATELENRHHDADRSHRDAGTAVPDDDPRLAHLVPRGRRERQLAIGWVYLGFWVGCVLMIVLAERRRARERVARDLADLRHRVGRLETVPPVWHWHPHVDAHGHLLKVVELEIRHRDADGRHRDAGTAVTPDRHRDANPELETRHRDVAG